MPNIYKDNIKYNYDVNAIVDMYNEIERIVQMNSNLLLDATGIAGLCEIIKKCYPQLSTNAVMNLIEIYSVAYYDEEYLTAEEPNEITYIDTKAKELKWNTEYLKKSQIAINNWLGETKKERIFDPKKIEKAFKIPPLNTISNVPRPESFPTDTYEALNTPKAQEALNELLTNAAKRKRTPGMATERKKVDKGTDVEITEQYLASIMRDMSCVVKIDGTVYYGMITQYTVDQPTGGVLEYTIEFVVMDITTTMDNNKTPTIEMAEPKKFITGFDKRLSNLELEIDDV